MYKFRGAFDYELVLPCDLPDMHVLNSRGLAWAYILLIPVLQLLHVAMYVAMCACICNM